MKELTTVSLVVTLLLVGVQGENPKTDAPLSSYEVVFGWNQIDFQFDSPAQKQEKLTSKAFIPENNVITGIKISDKRLFLSVPRFRPGVPATLTYVEYNPNTTTPNNPLKQIANGPLLIPYPNWQMQTLGNCDAFQYVQSMEIDPFNRLWVLDTGIHSTAGLSDCPAKLVLIDLATNQTVTSYTFPPQVVAKEHFLNDIAVSCSSSSDDCWAYITDALQAKIIVFHLRNKQSWAVRHSSMKVDNSSTNITMLGKTYKFSTNVDGVALSPLDRNFDTLYYSVLSSYNLYSVATKTLQMAGSSGNEQALQDSDVTNVGVKSSQSDGLAMDSTGLLFFGDLASNSVSYWNSSTTSKLSSNNTNLLIQNDIDLQWPNTFAFDNNGYLYATTNRLQRFISSSYDFNDINFRVIRVYIGTKSYQHSASELLAKIGLVDTTTTPTSAVPAPPAALPAAPQPGEIRVNGTNTTGTQYEHIDSTEGSKGRASSNRVGRTLVSMVAEMVAIFGIAHILL